MYSYEKFFAVNFPNWADHFASKIEGLDALQIARRKALRFLSMECSVKHGYASEIMHSRDESKSVYYLPTTYESALLLPMLYEEDICPEVTETLQRILLSSRRETGNWNYLLDETEGNSTVFPEDVDDTSLALMALYLTNRLTLYDTRKQAELMLTSVMRTTEGVMSTWLQVSSSRNIVHKKYRSVHKMDLGTLLNGLWLFAQVGMDTKSEILPSVHFVATFLDSLHEHQVGDISNSMMAYYVNRFVVYFFISRFLAKSDYARQLFGEKFKYIILDELSHASRELSHAMDIAGLILAALTVNLHTPGTTGDSRRVCETCVALADKLVSLQNDDGSFPRHILFRWNNHGYFGGSKIDTSVLALNALGKVEREIRKKHVLC